MKLSDSQEQARALFPTVRVRRPRSPQHNLSFSPEPVVPSVCPQMRRAPARQYWALKKKFADTVLFFKVRRQQPLDAFCTLPYDLLAPLSPTNSPHACFGRVPRSADWYFLRAVRFGR